LTTTSTSGFKHFFNWEMWNTLCTHAKVGGSSKQYVTFPSLAQMRNGPF
jgi:hypothetical protein